MNTLELISHGWTANPTVLGALAAAGTAYAAVVGRRGQLSYFAGAVVIVGVALLSPLNELAAGVFFTAHMAQHILLLLIVPALVLLSLPQTTDRRPRSMVTGIKTLSALTTGTTTTGLPDETGKEHGGSHARPGARARLVPIVGWAAGVGSMWFWHVPQFCDAAATSSAIHALQTLSLLAMGTAFWWPILTPSPAARLSPAVGIAYLFTACLACTALGILLTLTPIEVCPVFRTPHAAPAFWSDLRHQLTAERDQQIGGLLMWLPMCAVYLAAILLELTRWIRGEGFEAAEVLPKIRDEPHT